MTLNLAGDYSLSGTISPRPTPGQASLEAWHCFDRLLTRIVATSQGTAHFRSYCEAWQARRFSSSRLLFEAHGQHQRPSNSPAPDLYTRNEASRQKTANRFFLIRQERRDKVPASHPQKCVNSGYMSTSTRFLSIFSPDLQSLSQNFR